VDYLVHHHDDDDDDDDDDEDDEDDDTSFRDTRALAARDIITSAPRSNCISNDFPRATGVEARAE
jgi:hypothetical protein